MVDQVALSGAVIERALRVSSASLHEASGRRGALPHVLKPLISSMEVSGRAFPVQLACGDNLRLHHAVYAASPGDVLVVEAGGDRAAQFGYWGDVLNCAAIKRGLGGLVITGGVRDRSVLERMALPVFAGSVAIAGTGKDPEGAGWIGEAITLGGVEVRRGDLVRGDADGVVALPAADAEKVVDAALQRERAEELIRQRIEAGETTVSIYNLPAAGALRPMLRRRQSFDVPGLAHGANPILSVSRVGSVVATGGVRGVNPQTGELGADIESQTRHMFANLGAALAAAGACFSDVVKVTVWIAARELRPALNASWRGAFPDANDRPARQTIVQTLADGLLIQCEALAVLPDNWRERSWT